MVNSRGRENSVTPVSLLVNKTTPILGQLLKSKGKSSSEAVEVIGHKRGHLTDENLEEYNETIMNDKV